MNQRVLGKQALYAVVMLGYSTSLAAGYSVVPCAPSCYDADSAVMDVTLGVSDCVIEDFEDATFIPEIMVSLIGTPTPGQLRNNEAQPWDGIQGYSNAIANSGDDGYDFLIEIPLGAKKFGVGFAHAGAAIEVWVNGSLVVPDVFGLPGIIVNGGNRNGYVVIEQEPGDDPIAEVELRSLAPDSNDFIQIDHVAMCPCGPSLAHHWTFEANPNDYLGGQVGTNNGALLTCATYRGQAGLAYLFGGTAYISTDYAPQLGADDSMTISVWAKMPDGLPLESGAIYGLEVSGGQEIRLILINADGTVQATFRDDNGNNAFVDTSQNMADGRWHHFAAVRDGTNDRVQLWVDGVLVDDVFSNNGAINFSNTRTLDIGANNHNTDPHRTRFSGSIDELRIYHSALTVEEIRALAGLPFPCYGDVDGDGDTDIFDFAIFRPTLVVSLSSSCPPFKGVL